MRTLVYIDAENISYERLLSLFDQLEDDKEIQLLGLKAYGSIAVLGRKYTLCLEHGVDFIDTSLIGQTRKNLADVKMAVDCCFDVQFYKNLERVIIASEDNDYLPLVYKLRSIGITVDSLASGLVKVDRIQTRQIASYLKDKGVFPLKRELSLDNTFSYLMKEVKDMYTEEDLESFFKARLRVLSKKLRTLGKLDAARIVAELDPRSVSYSSFVKATKLTGEIEESILKDLYTYQMYGVAAPKA